MNSERQLLEIERKYLLSDMPPLPPGATRVQILQGYLEPEDPDVVASGQPPRLDSDVVTAGRLRRKIFEDGRTLYLHTIKRGFGLVREEYEHELTEAQFQQAWKKTDQRRISKTRYLVDDGELEWAIDQLHDIDLVLAEVELPSEQTAVSPPGWLKPHIVREVTDDRQYTNENLARMLAAGGKRTET